MNPGIIEGRRGIQVFLAPVGQTNHRATVIQTACDLEACLSELLSAFFVSRNPSVSHELALSELYSDGRVLSSLRKMADVALYLGLISLEQRYDLKQLAALRDHYAHGRTLKQLTEEPKLYAFITKTHLFRNNQLELVGLDEQAVFFCVRDQLMADLTECLKAFNVQANIASAVTKDA